VYHIYQLQLAKASHILKPQKQVGKETAYSDGNTAQPLDKGDEILQQGGNEELGRVQ
jgi:hypothetical protein